MKKQYQIPDLEIKILSSTDMITTSPLSDSVDKSDGEWGFNPWVSEVTNYEKN